MIDNTGSVEDIHAFIYCKKWRFGQVLPMPHSLTDSQSKDRATQLLKKYKSGALVTQFLLLPVKTTVKMTRGPSHQTISTAQGSVCESVYFKV